jgi:phosphoribosylformylglycinamidine synthase
LAFRYQEQDALLVRPEHRELFESICRRENVPVAFVGVVTGDGHIKLVDHKTNTTPVDLPLELVLGKMPKKASLPPCLPCLLS